MLGAAPFALAVPAAAQEQLVDVTFSGDVASDLGLPDGTIVPLPISLAADTCGLSEAELTLLPSCDADTSSGDLEDFLDDEDHEDNGNGDDNSAKASAPGQLKGDGESAREFAPGQVKGDGESAKESAPGQQKKSGD